VGVLWATHLVDEVADNDHVVLLHKGCVRFSGAVPNLLEAAQANNLRSAFMRVTAEVA
jgi:ABC-2 type transport system ATP-binding protein